MRHWANLGREEKEKEIHMLPSVYMVVLIWCSCVRLSMGMVSIGRLRVGVDTVIIHARARDSPPWGLLSLSILRAGLVVMVIRVLQVMVAAIDTGAGGGVGSVLL